MTRRAGFTLVETLVALTLLAMIGLLGLNLVQAASLGWRRAPTNLVEHARILATVRAPIAHATPVWLDRGPGAPHVDFSGSAETLELLAPAPAAFAPGGLARWRLAFQPAGEHERALRIAVWPREGAATPVDASLALPHLVGGAFAYFGRKDQAPAPGWSDDWRGQPRLPDLVRLHLEFPADAAALSGVVLIHPMIQAVAGCHSAAAHPCADR